MEQKINIAETLDGCPKDTKLYSPIFGDVYLEKIRPHLAVVVTTESNDKEEFLYDGRYGINGECVLFPSKDQRDWSKFQRPFKDGDIVATEEEKQRLFDAIKNNGYEWNPESKTLEKLTKPEFKVGDEIVKRNSISNSWIVYSVNSEYYRLKLPNGYEGIGVLPVSEQDDWELVSNKFDISNLKAYDKVLVRDDNNSAWINTFFGFYDTVTNKKYPFIAGCVNWAQCIPYEENKHLLGTTNDCNDFYKTWEE